MANSQQIESVLKNAIRKLAAKECASIFDVRIIIASDRDDTVTPEYYLQIASNEKRKLKFGDLYNGPMVWSVESGARSILATSIRKNASEKNCKSSEIEIHVCAESEDQLYYRLFPEQAETRLNIDQVIAKR